MRHSGEKHGSYQKGSQPRSSSTAQGSSDFRKHDKNHGQERSYSGSGRDEYHHRRPQAGGRGSDSGAPMSILQNNAAARAKGALLQEALVVEEYGTIISLRTSFGFIQNIHSDEQVYFSEQDIYPGVKVGDHVAFTAQQSSKGLAATKIKQIPDAVEVESLATKVLGTIARIPERHRSNCGLIEVELSSISPELQTILRRKPANTICYRPKDLEQLPRNVLLDRGDFVEFTMCKANATNLILATDIRLKQLKREREREKAIAQQIQRMLDAGAVREIGIITAVKNKEYGFIKAQDRKDELYFRMDGFLGDEGAAIKEGTEVEFFVVAEMVRGRLSDRAMHLRVIPQGTVQFEAVVARDALVTVVTEPGVQAEETPGVGVLPEPVSVADITKKPNDVINDVEVWQRCMPDEMVCRRGDVLKVNVHYYRPEKLFFIRAVRLVEPFLLGRDKGTVCAIKESAGFGFIASDSRKQDLYFRINQVIAAGGEMLKKSEVVEGLRVSFDVIAESDKLRATRVKVLSVEKSDSKDSSSKEAPPTRIPIKHGVFGKVVRSTTSKKESVGLIQISPEVWREIQEFEYVDPDLNKSLSSFMSKVFLQEITLPCISTSLRKQLCALIDKDFLELMYEVVDGNILDGVLQKDLRITKLYGGKRTAAPAQNGQKSGKDSVPKDGYTLSYTRDDYATEHFGPLGNDMEVSLDVAWDVIKGKRVAQNVRLTDEAVADVPEEQVGLLDVLIEKGDKFGFIRCIPTWEKLFWHISSVVEGQASALKQGSYVAFSLRRRGGMRCAAQIRVLSEDEELYEAAVVEEVIPSTETAPILAVVVERNRAVLLDAMQTASLKDKILPLAKMTTLLAEADAQSKTWEKGVKVAKDAAKDVAAASTTSTDATAVTAGTTAASAVGPVSESGSLAAQNDRVEYAAKFFGHIAREPVLITNPLPEESVPAVSGSTEEGTDAAEVKIEDVAEPLYKVGDIVEVSVHVNWALARPITSVTVVKSVGQALGGSVKRRGTLTKVGHRFKNMPHLSDFYHLNNVDFAEITELEEIPISEKDSALAAAAPPPNASTTGNVVPTKQKINYYFCVQDEIRVVAANGATAASAGTETVAIDDDVEFCVAPMFPNIALFVRTIPRKKEQELNFTSNRQGINDKLKLKVGSTNVVSMAAGPPSDSAKGFEPGWRALDLDSVRALPWASSLLGHLLTNAAPSPVVVSTQSTPVPPPAATTTSSSDDVATPPPPPAEAEEPVTAEAASA